MPPVEVEWKSGRIVCHLPITQPTSKVRIKRGGMPLAPRQNNLKDCDLIEWQISYRNREGRLSELGQMLRIGYRKGAIGEDVLIKLQKFGDNINKFFDECYEITVEVTEQKFLGEFTVLMRQVPIVQRELTNGCFVEGELKHKQRAVGYQPMLYVFIPVQNVISRHGGLVGRPACKKEVVDWCPSVDDIIGITRTFVVLSRKHRDDIQNIIHRLLQYR